MGTGRQKLTCAPKRYQRARHRAADSTDRSTAKQLAVINQVVIAEKLLCASVYRERRGACPSHVRIMMFQPSTA
jgi:hypothetical protein